MAEWGVMWYYRVCDVVPHCCGFEFSLQTVEENQMRTLMFLGGVAVGIIGTIVVSVAVTMYQANALVHTVAHEFNNSVQSYAQIHTEATKQPDFTASLSEPSIAKPPAVPQKSVVETFSGSGMTTTQPFVVDNGWEIEWNAKWSGDVGLFQLFLYAGDGTLTGFAANQTKPGKGSSYQAKAGEYYLTVNTLGDWDIKIVQVKK